LLLNNPRGFRTGIYLVRHAFKLCALFGTGCRILCLLYHQKFNSVLLS